MNLPTKVKLACMANILSALYLLSGESELADVHCDVSEELLAGMPPDLQDLAAETIIEGLRGFVPALHELANQIEGMAPRGETTELVEDTGLEAALQRINTPNPGGCN